MADPRITLALLASSMPSNTWPNADCVAWIDSADRWCGRDRTEGLLCARHHTVALRRLAKHRAAAPAREARAAAKLAAARERARARLTRVEAELRRLDPPATSTDPAIVNTPLRTRMPSDARIHRLSELVREAERLRRIVN